MTTPSSTTYWDDQLARYDRFVAHIQKICHENPGRRASLRRSVGRLPEQADYRVHGVVEPFLPTGRVSRAEERALYAVAALIAAQPRTGRDHERIGDTDDTDPHQNGVSAEDGASNAATLTTTVNGAAAVGENTGPASEQAATPAYRKNLGDSLARAVPRALSERTAEARLHLLARQGLDGAHRHLPGLIRLLRGQRIPVDWTQLIVDLIRIDRDRGFVSKQWLRSFYRTLRLANAKRATDTPTTADQTGATAE